jgi:hypothetical protein
MDLSRWQSAARQAVQINDKIHIDWNKKQRTTFKDTGQRPNYLTACWRDEEIGM